MARRRVRLTFSPRLVTEPVIHQLGSRFAVVTNIRRADVTRDEGWVVLEVEGEPDDVERSLAWCADLGVRVDPVEGELAT
ncbi:MAG: L-aspartate semialdehyde sulfurtransferase ferredoxin [Chloroflexota bacterium]|nr:L-aspartate semialdehyde sulfurtransferase ferredoxin [Chloroflexota bacterium]